MKPSKARITKTRMAGEDHAVHTIEGGSKGTYRREPCGGCPWRVDQTDMFPAQAFKHSAPTSYDMSTHTFACHESGQKKPATCAGFLLRAHHNLSVRLSASQGLVDFNQLSDGGHELHDDYRAMAIANGVDPNDPVLAPCR